MTKRTSRKKSCFSTSKGKETSIHNPPWQPFEPDHIRPNFPIIIFVRILHSRKVVCSANKNMFINSSRAQCAFLKSKEKKSIPPREQKREILQRNNSKVEQSKPIQSNRAGSKIFPPVAIIKPCAEPTKQVVSLLHYSPSSPRQPMCLQPCHRRTQHNCPSQTLHRPSPGPR